MIFWSFGPLPGLCHADRESRLKDGRGQIALNKTGWGQRGERGGRRHSQKVRKNEGEKISSSLKEKNLGTRDSCTGGLGITKLLGCFTEAVIRGVPMWALEIWLWLGRTLQRFFPKILQSHCVVTGSSFLLPFTHTFRSTRYKTQLFLPFPPKPAHSKLLWEWQTFLKIWRKPGKRITTTQHKQH